MTPPAFHTLLSLEGRVALVAGAAGGIGSAVCGRLLEAGATVVAVDLPGKAFPDGTVGTACDLADPRSVDEVVDGIERRFGRLDVVVHGAGITRDGVVWKLSDAEWSEVLRVNLDSAFYLMRRAIPAMRRVGAGAVVLVSSINGERGKLGQANYAASKAGLNALARSAAREGGRFGIRVNVVAPGLIATPMTAALDPAVRKAAVGETVLGREGTPDDVARAVLFLATPMSGHVTGQVLRVDGGQLIA